MVQNNKTAQNESTFSFSSTSSKLGDGWYRSFMIRHKDKLKARAAHILEPERALVNGDQIKAHFDLIKSEMEKFKFEPWAIANFDETMVQALKDRSKLVIPASCRHYYTVEQDAPFHMTIGQCIFANGDSMKPLVIVPLKTFPQEVIMSEPDIIQSFDWSGQDSGWITAEIFKEWVQKSFIPEIKMRRLAREKPDEPVLLFVDGHSSRADPDTIKMLMEANVVVIVFPAHASHLLQPLDCWMYMQFKQQLGSLRSITSNCPRPEQRLTMLRAVRTALRVATEPHHVTKSFKRAGIYPFNPEEVFHPVVPAPTEGDNKKKRSRSGININARVLTSQELILELEKKKQGSPAKNTTRANKKKKRTN